MSAIRMLGIFAAAALLTVPTIAAAPDTIKARQTNFKAMGRSMKMISDELKKDTPSYAIIRRESLALERAGARVGGFFPKGTGAEAGVKTGARAAIWAKPADFRTAAANLNKATRNLRLVTAGTDVRKSAPRWARPAGRARRVTMISGCPIEQHRRRHHDGGGFSPLVGLARAGLSLGNCIVVPRAVVDRRKKAIWSGTAGWG